jgi:hypothetical protein
MLCAAQSDQEASGVYSLLPVSYASCMCMAPVAVRCVAFLTWWQTGEESVTSNNLSCQVALLP